MIWSAQHASVIHSSAMFYQVQLHERPKVIEGGAKGATCGESLNSFGGCVRKPKSSPQMITERFFVDTILFLLLVKAAIKIYFNLLRDVRRFSGRTFLQVSARGVESEIEFPLTLLSSSALCFVSILQAKSTFESRETRQGCSLHRKQTMEAGKLFLFPFAHLIYNCGVVKLLERWSGAGLDRENVAIIVQARQSFPRKVSVRGDEQRMSS